LARTKRGAALYSLHHVIDLDWMKEAYRLTRKDGAPGIDGVTAADYEVNLEANLLALLDRIKSGRYRAPPVRRAYIPKADGSQRPLGIPTFEDKVAQRAVTMVLEEIYEQDFLPCSYGFRPGRSAHQALRTLQNVLWAKRLYWVLDIDIRKYFDSIPHFHLRAFLDQRVTDGVIKFGCKLTTLRLEHIANDDPRSFCGEQASLGCALSACAPLISMTFPLRRSIFSSFA
jgi:group II intron reverse transcriptase/maturase